VFVCERGGGELNYFKESRDREIYQSKRARQKNTKQKNVAMEERGGEEREKTTMKES